MDDIPTEPKGRVNAAVRPSGDHQPTTDDKPVEEMEFKEKCELLKKFNVNFKKGDYIDAKDTISQWCLAQITEVGETRIKVHFDGWPSRWDLDFKFHSYKLAPFRKVSTGYTGQPKNPLRKELTMNAENIQAVIPSPNLSANRQNEESNEPKVQTSWCSWHHPVSQRRALHLARLCSEQQHRFP